MAEELGVPVRGVVARLIIGRDENDVPCVYGVMGQESGHTLFVYQLKPDTGEMKQFDAPPDSATGGRPALWSEKYKALFIVGSGGQVGHAHGPAMSCLLRFDPRKGEVEKVLDIDPAEVGQGYTVAEAPDGRLYIGHYHEPCSMSRFDPGTGEIEHFGCIDDIDCYALVSCGDDGTVAAEIKMAYPHVVAIDVNTGEHHRVGPTADTDKKHGFVHLYKAADGLLYINSHEGVFRVRGTEVEPVAAAPPAAPPDPTKLRARLLDQGVSRRAEVNWPDGRVKVFDLKWEGGGSSVYHCRPGPDGKVYGASALPLHFFSYDPATGAMVDHGNCSTSGGQIYSMASLGGKLYFCAYTHANLSEYDPAKPYQWNGDPKDATNNPRLLGRMDDIAYRPRDMVAGPAGKVWVTSICDYGMWGGTLSWYDPKAGTFGGGHRHIIRDCNPQAIAHLAEPDLLAIGFSFYGGSATKPRADRGGFALWDPHADKCIWTSDLDVPIVGVMDMADAGGNLAYAIVHPLPEDVLVAELWMIDMVNQRIVERRRMDEITGWPLEVAFQRDDRYVYGAAKNSVYRIPLGTTDIEIIEAFDDQGPTAGGALVDGTYYFARGETLSSVNVP